MTELAGDLAHLRRYASIVDDPDAFLEAAARPLDRVVWANPRRGDLDDTAARLLVRCPEARPLGWWPHAWRLPPESRPGTWPEHLLGLLHGQEEAALWVAPLLEARPGERVLDLCAAPGNKTAQIALDMDDDGLVVANDRSIGRLASLRRTLDRLGITCAAVTHQDGGSFPGEAGSYDRALVDAPCSCEGTSRKPGGRQTAAADGHRAHLQAVQIRLLRRALKLVRPGGVVVYATCTYAPEENEAVLDDIPIDRAVIEPIAPPAGLPVAPGVAEWEGHAFRPDVVHAARLWPHHADTGGFFVARLRRL